MKHHKFAYYAKNRKLFIRFSVVLFSSLMLILFSLFMQIRVFETKKNIMKISMVPGMHLFMM